MTYVLNYGTCSPRYGLPPRSVLAPSGIIDQNGNPVSAIDTSLPDMDSLKLGARDESMKAYVYGNWWAQGQAQSEGGRIHLRLVGIGARFCTSPSIFDSIHAQEGTAHIRGSAISIILADSGFVRLVNVGYKFRYRCKTFNRLCQYLDVTQRKIPDLPKVSNACTSGSSLVPSRILPVNQSPWVNLRLHGSSSLPAPTIVSLWWKQGAR